MSGVIKVTAPETAAALRYVLDAFSDKTDMLVLDAIAYPPWREVETAALYLMKAEEALHEIIAEIVKD